MDAPYQTEDDILHHAHVNGPDTADFVTRPEEVLRWKSERLEWGHFERERAGRAGE